MISTTDSALAWSRLALRRGSEETMVFLFFYRTREKNKKEKSPCQCFIRLFLSLFSFVLPSLSLSLSREERDNRRGGRRSISLPLSRSLLSPITSF